MLTRSHATTLYRRWNHASRLACAPWLKQFGLCARTSPRMLSGIACSWLRNSAASRLRELRRHEHRGLLELVRRRPKFWSDFHIREDDNCRLDRAPDLRLTFLSQCLQLPESPGP